MRRGMDGGSRGRTKGVPEDQGEIIVLFSFLTELKQGSVAGLRVHELNDEGVYLFVVLGASDGACNRARSRGCELGDVDVRAHEIWGEAIGRHVEVAQVEVHAHGSPGPRMEE